MSDKLRRDFLVAVNEDWYQALTEKAAQKAERQGKEVLQVRAPMQGSRVLGVSDFYNLTHIAVKESSGVRQELARALASFLIKNPDKMIWLVSMNRHHELEKRYYSLDLDAKFELRDYTGENIEQKVKDLDSLRELPEEYYCPEKLAEIEYLTKKTELILAINNKLDSTSSEKPGKEKHIIALLMQEDSLSAEDLVRCADACGFHYGDPPNNYDGPSKEEMRVYFDIASAVTRHWDDFNGGQYDALCVRKKSPNGKVFLTRKFIEEKYSIPDLATNTPCPQ